VRNCVRYFVMTTISATQARKNLYSLIDEANDSHQPIQITGKRSNAVLLSESDWRAIQETLHLQAIPGMVDSIKQASEEGIEQASDELVW
jgi:antitoxin YefM